MLRVTELGLGFGIGVGFGFRIRAKVSSLEFRFGVLGSRG